MFVRFSIFVCVLFMFSVSACDSAKNAQSLDVQSLIIKDQNGKEHLFKAQIADDPEEQQTGLMHVKSMPDNSGMLFVFPKSAPRRFWMKNTLIPLDLFFISDNGIVHHIHENAKPHDLTGLLSNGDARAVLEVNGGTAKRLGIRVGSFIDLSDFQ